MWRGTRPRAASVLGRSCRFHAPQWKAFEGSKVTKGHSGCSTEKGEKGQTQNSQRPECSPEEMRADLTSMEAREAVEPSL